jgi:hypothetical protein
MTTWKKTTEERYYEMLGIVPPAEMTGLGFLVGEAMDHNSRGRPRYAAFARVNELFYEADEPLTVAEFRAVKSTDITA